MKVINLWRNRNRNRDAENESGSNAMATKKMSQSMMRNINGIAFCIYVLMQMKAEKENNTLLQMAISSFIKCTMVGNI